MNLKNFPERFKSARKMNGLSLQDLSDKLDNKISKQALNKYETGQTPPDSSLLPDLAKALNVSQEYFFRINSVELGSLTFRKLAKLSGKEQDRVIYTTKDTLVRYLELEDIIGINSEFVNPARNEPVRNIQDVETVAELLRDDWKLGRDPLFNLVELLEDLKIKVIEITADDSFSGMSTWVNHSFPVIVLNNNECISLDRIRFTALHELGHLVLNIGHLTQKEQELYCNAFAGAMLIPKSKMREELGNYRKSIYLSELGTLKLQYGISMQAIIYRAKHLEIITESYHKLLMIRFNKLGYRKKEPIQYDYKGSEHSNRFRQLLLRAVAEELISTSKGAQLNNQKLSAFRAELV